MSVAFAWRNDHMEMIGHQDRCKEAPFLKLCGCVLECVESRLVCQHAFAIFNADCDKIDYGLFPAQPNGNSWRVAHLRNLAGEAPALQRFSRAKETRESQGKRRLPYKSIACGLFGPGTTGFQIFRSGPSAP